MRHPARPRGEALGSSETGIRSVARTALQMARRWSDSLEDAEDIAQEALVRLITSGDSIRHLEPWLFVVTRRLAGSLVHRRIEERAGRRGLEPPSTPRIPPIDTFLGTRDAVCRLPCRDRQVLSLALLGFSYAEMSSSLGCPENQVGQRLARARRKACAMAGR